ncbi:DUF2505 domain-containing protein [Nocardioides scoriae]|uniref:DUF2505 domain-containing protein n=1 Tax=Nocardioides scoriae TaxID=642780 RepID=UPI0012F8BF67|nr:DUF2505 domain-containing protein [Nocardioides scoriae]
MQLAHTITYAEATPAQVHAMLADPEFRRRSSRAQGVLTADVSVLPNGEGMSVRVDELQPARGVPEAARRFVGETVRLVRLEEWSDDTGGTVVDAPGKPVSVTGTVRLEAVGTGTTQTLEVEVDVRVPLLGGRLASFVGELVAASMDTEQQVGTAWLRGERG